MANKNSTTIVIGLDGAHFELLTPWIDDGKLPNIETAINDGVSSDLLSVLPPVTSPNWKSYATGKNPGKIGIFWWENIDTDRREIYYPTSRKSAHDHYWEYIADKNNVGVVGVPLTYPPRSFDGFLAAGAPDGEDSGYTHPPEFEAELQERFDYRVTKQNRLDTDREDAVNEILDLIERRFEVGSWLLDEEDLDFLQITTFYINSLHHFLWDDEATLDAWQIVDEYIGEFLREDYNIVLMSDHGSTEIDWEFHINAWLEEKGYLTTELGLARFLHRLGITTDRLIEYAATLNIHQIAKRYTPNEILRHLPNENQEISRERKASHVDWEQTQAIASGQGPIYLTAPPDKDNYNRIREDIIRELREVETPGGNPIAERVVPGEEVYNGEYLDEAPDIVIDQKEGIHISGRIGRGNVFSVPEADAWRAENKRRGLFVGCGPDFATGDVDEISILDLGPTLMHLFGWTIPSEMDGEVQTSVFASESTPKEQSVEISKQKNRPHLEQIRRIARQSDL